MSVVYQQRLYLYMTLRTVCTELGISEANGLDKLAAEATIGMTKYMLWMSTTIDLLS